MPNLPSIMAFPARKNFTGIVGRITLLYIFVLLIAANGSLRAHSVQPGHYAPGWNGNLKAGIMAPDPDKRPLAATAEFMEVFGVLSIIVGEDDKNVGTLRFDHDRSLEERVIAKQIAFWKKYSII